MTLAAAKPATARQRSSSRVSRSSSRRGRERIVGRQPEAQRRDQAGMVVGVGWPAPCQRSARRRVDRLTRARDDGRDCAPAGSRSARRRRRSRARRPAGRARRSPCTDGRAHSPRNRCRAAPGRWARVSSRRAVEGAEAGRADDGVGAGAAAAAERGVARQPRRLSPQCAQVRAAARGSRAVGEEGARRSLQEQPLVSAQSVARRASTTMSTSQLPRAGRTTSPANLPSSDRGHRQRRPAAASRPAAPAPTTTRAPSSGCPARIESARARGDSLPGCQRASTRQPSASRVCCCGDDVVVVHAALAGLGVYRPEKEPIASHDHRAVDGDDDGEARDEEPGDDTGCDEQWRRVIMAAPIVRRADEDRVVRGASRVRPRRWR